MFPYIKKLRIYFKFMYFKKFIVTLVEKTIILMLIFVKNTYPQAIY